MQHLVKVACMLQGQSPVPIEYNNIFKLHSKFLPCIPVDRCTVITHFIYFLTVLVIQYAKALWCLSSIRLCVYIMPIAVIGKILLLIYYAYFCRFPVGTLNLLVCFFTSKKNQHITKYKFYFFYVV